MKNLLEAFKSMSLSESSQTPISTKNNMGERDPEMHQTKKGNEWYSSMKTHICADAESGYRAFTKREEFQEWHHRVDWQVVMMPGKRRALKKSKNVNALIDKF